MLYGSICVTHYTYIFGRCTDELGQIGKYTLLAGALTFLFSMYIFRLAKRNEDEQSYESMKIMPILKRYRDTFSLAGDGTQICTISVKNVGYGSAKNLQFRATSGDGRQLAVDPCTPGKNEVEAWRFSEWNVRGIKVGDQIDVEVSYTDIKDNPCSALRFTVGAQ